MIVLSIDNPLFSNYVEEKFRSENMLYRIISPNQLLRNLEILKNTVLLIQSDTDEDQCLNLTKRLKRLFGMEIKIVFFSSDYLFEDDVKNTCDAFLPAPCPFLRIQETLLRLSTSQKKILLIDDSKLVHSQLVPALKEEGYEVFEAYNGKEGYDLASKEIPELIICDIEMPVMNGFEACQKIRANPQTQDIYIIMSSTLGSASDMQKGFESGVDEYITKPVIIPELMERISRVFKQTLSGREDILVLEPDEILSLNIGKSLKKQGFSAKHVKTIDMCLKQMKKSNYDLLIIDSEIPNASAMDFLLQWKGYDHPSKPSVLLLMDRENSADAKMAINMGVSSVLSKPFSMDNLLAIIERVLAVKRANSEKQQLLRYMSKSSVRIAEEKAKIQDGGSGSRAINCSASILFADIVSFTTRCEHYTATQVVEQINLLFSIMSKIIQKHGGDIDKFMGDSCMAFWMSEDTDRDNEYMMAAGMEIFLELNALNHSHPILQGDPLKIRMGMNSGEVILCDLGSPESRIDLTIIGDNVNLASRLEAACKQYGVQMIIADSVNQSIQSNYLTRQIDRVQVVGKELPTDIFEVIGRKNELELPIHKWVEEFNEGIQHYLAGRYEEALDVFTNTQGREVLAESKNPSQIYIDRCRHLIQHPPDHWNGIWRLKEK